MEDNKPARHEITQQDVVKPRITTSMLPNFINHEVTLVGTILEISGPQLILAQSKDAPQIIAFVNEVRDAQEGSVIELVGIVQDEKTIRESYNTNFTLPPSQVDFDFETYEKALLQVHSNQYSFLFTK